MDWGSSMIYNRVGVYGLREKHNLSGKSVYTGDTGC